MSAPSAERPSDESLASTFYLGVFDDHLRGLPLVEGTLLVGRSGDNHLRLHDHLLSRKHCSLNVNGGKLVLVDLNSSNGTYVNGDRVGTCELALDDIIELGRTVMVVYDGSAWRRGEGLMNLRNPVKAQELIHKIHEAGKGFVNGSLVRPGPPQNGVRPHKGISAEERAFLRWLETDEQRLLPSLVSDYLHHKLVSLLVRNSPRVRAAFTTVLEDMLRPEFFRNVGSLVELKRAVEELVAKELADLDDTPGLDGEPGDRPSAVRDDVTAAAPPSGDETDA